MCGCGSDRSALHAWAAALVALVVLGVAMVSQDRAASPPRDGAAPVGSSAIAR